MKTKVYVIAVLLGLLSVIQNAAAQEIKNGMIKVSILYPAGEGKTFDMTYYSTKHIPLITQLLSDSLKYISIDKGISGRTSDIPATYVAICHLYFNRLSTYLNTMKQHGEKIRNYIQNYTNILPVIQISEVIK